ncbi:MAG: ParB/RepB/Spo0J family partition protein, partial [Terriglobales bacterium]
SMDEEKLEELTESIRRMGVLQNLIVVPSNDRYEIVAGHRRYHAAQRAGLTTVPCRVFTDGELAKAAAMLHENTYREDLTAAEEAVFYRQLIDQGNLTEVALCALVQQKPDYIYARLDLLKGDAKVFEAVLERKLNFSVARELNKTRCDLHPLRMDASEPEGGCPRCSADTAHRRYLLDSAISSGASVSMVRQWIHEWKLSKVPAPAASSAQPTSEGLAAPAGPSNWCEVCGQAEDAQNLVLVHVHSWEVEQYRKVISALREPQPR